MMDLPTEVGIVAISKVCQAVCRGTAVGKMFSIGLKYLQLESGLDIPILSSPGIEIPWLAPTYSLRSVIVAPSVGPRKSSIDIFRVFYRRAWYRFT